MEVGKLTVNTRTSKGSSTARKLRQKGQIPAVCYGKGVDPILLSLDPAALQKALDPEKRTNTVIALSVAGGETINVMLRDWQRDALRGNVTHADFIRVDLTKDVHATVPVILVGKPEGVKLGGTLHQVLRQLEVACTPDKIPVKLEINVDALGMGDALHVSDLTLPAGVKPRVEGGSTVCTVTVPKAEKVAETVVEGEAAAIPAEGAAAAPAAEGGAAKTATPAAGKGAAPAKAEAKPAAEKKGK